MASNITATITNVRNEFGHVTLEWTVFDPNVYGSSTLQLSAVEVWTAAGVNNFASASKVVEGRTRAVHANVLEGVTYYYWLVPRNNSGDTGSRYPASSTDGVPCLVQFANSAAQDMVNMTFLVTPNYQGVFGAMRIDVKTLAGTDPSEANPIIISYPSTSVIGAVDYRQITTPIGLTISSGSSFWGIGTTSIPYIRLWMALFDDAGTLRLAVQNNAGSQTAPPLMEGVPASAFAEGGAGNADSIGLWYAEVAITSKQYRMLGYAEWGSGLAQIGEWVVPPTNVRKMGPLVRLPGQLLQQRIGGWFNVSSGTTVMPSGNTLPLMSTHGNFVGSIGFTPSERQSRVEVEAILHCTASVAGPIAMSAFVNTQANPTANDGAWATTWGNVDAADERAVLRLMFDVSNLAMEPWFFLFQAGAQNAGTFYWRRTSAASSPYGGTLAGLIRVKEIAAA